METTQLNLGAKHGPGAAQSKEGWRLPREQEYFVNSSQCAKYFKVNVKKEKKNTENGIKAGGRCPLPAFAFQMPRNPHAIQYNFNTSRYVDASS